MSGPWMKFYPSDWRADPALRMCSLGARGLWAEMMCIMHEAEPYGFLLIKGIPISDKQLASLAGTSIREITKHLSELDASGVFSRDEAGVIFSRRMVRDRHLADEGRNAAQRRWNSGQPNGSPNGLPTGEPNTQKPDTRVQNKKEIRTVAKATRPADDLFEKFWKAYPKRKGGNPKAPAEKLFNAAVKAGADPPLIIGAIEAKIGFDPDKIGTEYIPQAVKWLRDKRWEEHTPTAPHVTEARTKFMADRGYVWKDARWQKVVESNGAAA